jgi:hypothetical protein
MDCDETFNYWDPLHYLLFGRGFQTWEYSPQFSLRTYAYVLLHAVFGLPQYLLNVADNAGAANPHVYQSFGDLGPETNKVVKSSHSWR